MKKKYYDVTFNKLSSLVRQGWINWRINAKRLEDDTEHIFGTQVLAVAMANNYYDKYQDLDISKILLMLANHEIGEAVIGDITPLQKEATTKKEKELIAVRSLTAGIENGNVFEKLFVDFDYQETDEAFFSYQCDKAQCDLRSKSYDLDKCGADLSNQEGNPALNSSKIRQLIAEGNTISELWIKYDLDAYPYDDQFKEVITDTLNYNINNDNINPVFKVTLEANKYMNREIATRDDKRNISYADIITGAEFLAMSEIENADKMKKVVALIVFNIIHTFNDRTLINELKGQSKALYAEAIALQSNEAKLANYYLQLELVKAMKPCEYIAYYKKLS